MVAKMVTGLIYNQRKKYKIYPNLFIHQLSDGRLGLFNPFTFKTAYIPSLYSPIVDLLSNPIDLRYLPSRFLSSADFVYHLDKLLNDKFLVFEDFNYEKEIEKIRDKIMSIPQGICFGHFILTNSCNIGCRYCYISGKMSMRDRNCRKMSLETAMKSAVIFSEGASISRKDRGFQVFFSGGEPLLNFEAIKVIAYMIRKEEKHNKFGKEPVRFLLTTNGTLITKEMARFISKNNIVTRISIDGFESIHNKGRCYRNGKSSFGETLKGYRLIKKEGGLVTIICSVGSHNEEKIEEIAEYFATELKPNGVMFNLMVSGPSRDNPFEASAELITRSILDSVLVLKEYGIVEERTGRYIEAIEKKRLLPYECSGCGDSLVFMPDGDVTLCHLCFSSKKYLLGNVDTSIGSILNNEYLKKWRMRSPLNMKECLYCPGISICGGGCVLEAEEKAGSIFKPLQRQCVFLKSFLKWYLENKAKGLL